MKSHRFYKLLISSFASEERHLFQTLKVFIKKGMWFLSNDKCTVLGYSLEMKNHFLFYSFLYYTKA